MNITNDIIIEAQLGNKEAINEIIEQCSPLIYFLAARELSGITDSADCTQVVMERVIRKLNYFDSQKTTFCTWFYVVVKRSIRNYKEQYVRNNQVELNDVEVLEHLDLDEAAYHKRRLSDIEEYVGEYLYHALMLRIGFELTFYEIAEELNIPYHKAKRDFHTAYDKAKKYAERIKWGRK